MQTTGFAAVPKIDPVNLPLGRVASPGSFTAFTKAHPVNPVKILDSSHSNRIVAERPCASSPSISLKVWIAGSRAARDFLSSRTTLVRRWN